MTEKAEETIHEKAAKEKADSRNPKNLKLKPTCFSAMALLILLVLAFQVWHRDANPLLKKNNSITLYREEYEGQMPEFRTEVFFPNNHFDYEKVTYDTSALDVNTPGVYTVPVLYDGEATNCVVEVTVKASETDETQETAPAGSGEAWEEAETE